MIDYNHVAIAIITPTGEDDHATIGCEYGITNCTADIYSRVDARIAITGDRGSRGRPDECPGADSAFIHRTTVSIPVIAGGSRIAA